GANGRGEHPAAPEDEHNATGASDPQAGRDNFFEKYKRGDGRDPPEVHHAGNEEKRHQKPAAADAVCTEMQSHLERASASVAPFGQQKADRGTAVAQACILERRPLEYTGGHEHNAAEDPASSDAHGRDERGAMEDLLRKSGGDAEDRPCSHVPEHEG